MTTTTHAEPASAGLIPSISIEALLAARDNAQRLLTKTAEALREAQAQLDRFGVPLPGVSVEFPGTTYLRLADERNVDAIKREVDRHVWVQLFRLTNIDALMDHDTRRKLFEQLGESQAYRRHRDEEEGALPDLTAENIEAVFQGIRDNQLEYFELCVESIYKGLSWDHSTNEPGRIGKKLIVYGAFHAWARSMQGDTVTLGHHEHIHDLERALCILNGDAPPTHTSPGLRTLGSLEWGKWYDVPNPNGGDPLLRIKVYRKGTAHLEIKKKKLVDDMNRIMAHRYPGAIPEPAESKASRKRREAKRPRPTTALAKSDRAARQAFYTPAELAEEVVEVAIGANGWGLTVLEPSAGEGSLVRAALRTRCKSVTAIENDPHGVELLSYLVDRVNIRDEGRMALDPRDFFDVSPGGSYPEGFDVVVMNPPFANAQEVEHVLHAWSFVKPGGKLVSIMSKGVQYRTTGRYKDFAAFLEENEAEIRPLPSGSFEESGTSVETVMVIIERE